MITARFIRGSNYIDVRIEDRKINFVTPILNHQLITIDLDKLDEHKEKIKKMKFDKKVLKELSKLKTEEDMFKDLKKDLNKSGWVYGGH